jgi:hypothetical protein
MIEVIVQWLYVLLASVGLAGDPESLPEPNWRGSTQTTAEATGADATTDVATGRRRRHDSFEGDIYNGF